MKLFLNNKPYTLIFILLLTLLSGCGQSGNGDKAEKLEVSDSPSDVSDKTPEAVDAQETQRLQERLMDNMQKVTEAQSELADDNISHDFDNSSEQHRQTFIDQTLQQTEETNEDEAKSLAEKLESAKEIEHAPLEDTEE